MLYRLVENTQLTATVWRMKLAGDTSAIKAPGQFVQLTVPGFYLRRPISICNWTKDALLLLVRVAGDGTREMVRSVPGTEFRTLSGLGNGFDVKACQGKKPLLMGGGIGIAPLYGLAQRLLEEGKVTKDGKALAKNYKLTGRETLEVSLPDPEPVDVVPQNIPLDIVFEDSDVIVVNKPKGLVVHPAPGHPDGTLVNALLYHCGDSLSGIGGELRPGIVHRIDRDTSGLIIAAGGRNHS